MRVEAYSSKRLRNIQAVCSCTVRRWVSKSAAVRHLFMTWSACAERCRILRTQDAGLSSRDGLSVAESALGTHVSQRVSFSELSAGCLAGRPEGKS